MYAYRPVYALVMTKARLYVLLERKEKAREVLLALLQQQPGHKLAQQALEMLN